MSRWPYQTNAANRIDKTQTKMISILLGLRVQPEEDPAAFIRRRGREARRVANQSGSWSSVWRRQVTNWSEHLNRGRNAKSWAAQTLHYHGKQWLMDQRQIHSVGQWGSLLAGRTCTRVAPGIVHKRWHDGVDVALNV